MIRQPPRSTRTDPLLPCTTPVRSAQFADRDLYGRDAIIYETLAQACSIFTDPPIVPIDQAGTIPQTSAWSLAQGLANRSDISPALPLSEIGRAPSELQSLMRSSYAVFGLKKKKSDKAEDDDK